MRGNIQLGSASWLRLGAPLLVILSGLSALSQTTQNPKKLLLSHILIKVSVDTATDHPDEVQLARKRAEAVLKAARSGTSFARLAAQYSEDTATADLGGSLGWVRRGQLTPALEDAAFQLKAGEISGIVQSPFGFHILRLVAVAEDHDTTFPPAPKFRELPVAPPKTSVEPSSLLSASHWPDPNNPRQTGVGKSIAELRELCNRHSDLPFGAKSNSKAGDYDCALAAIQMDYDYETLVDRISSLQKQLCLLYNGSLPERVPTAPELAQLWKEDQLLTQQWEKRSAALLDELKRTEDPTATTHNDVEAENNRKLAAHERAQRLIIDYWRVHSNCGNGL